MHSTCIAAAQQKRSGGGNFARSPVPRVPMTPVPDPMHIRSADAPILFISRSRALRKIGAPEDEAIDGHIMF
jgi:hypothetical protein